MQPIRREGDKVMSLTDETREESNATPILVGIGTRVEVELVDESGAGELLVVDIVPDSQADFSSGFLGAGTPLAQAILGQPAGTVVPYKVGDILQVRILKVASDASTPPADIDAKRQAVIQQAIAQSELVSDMAFALAVGSKWGDYDPGEIASDQEEHPVKGPVQ
jgi:Transcription elongation factor, GreA/GreB, C-term